jgi:hypothetical protein
MAISGSAPHITEQIGGESRRLLIRNGEIERFEAQHAAKIVDGVEYTGTGIFELFDQLFGRGAAPQVRHVRDLIALGLVGGGMSDRAADALIAALPPSENAHLRLVAQRLLGVTFLPAVLEQSRKKRRAGSRGGAASQPQADTTPAPASETSAAPSPE